MIGLMENQLSDQSAVPVAEQIVSNLQVLLDLSKQPISSQAFFQRLLDLVISSLQAQSGVIWKIRQNKTEAFVQSGTTATFEEDVFSGDREAVLLAFLTQDSTKHLSRPCHAAKLNDGSVSKIEQVHLSAHFLLRDEESTVVLELIHRENADWINSPSFSKIINAVRELAIDFHRNRELEFLRKQNRDFDSLFEFNRNIHGRLDLDPILFEVVNELCQLLPVDRVTFYRRLAKRYELALVSGVSNISSSSQMCKAMEAAVNEAAGDGLPYQYFPTDNSTAPTNSRRAAYFNDTNCTRMVAFPISNSSSDPADKSEPWGVLVLENFDTNPPAISNSLMALVLKSISQSLKNALEYQHAKQRGPLKQLGNLRSGSSRLKSRRFGIVAAAVAIGILLLFLINVDFEIKAVGRILPRYQQRIFSPADGEIVEVFAQPDDAIEIGMPLLRINDAELDLRLSKTQGERLATVEKLQAIESRRITGNQQIETRGDGDQALLSATAEELRVLLISQREQIEILKQQLGKLTLLSPLNGKVTTWQFEKLLASRPVKRGQLLMTVADTGGQWDGELEIRDHRVGHVLAAMNEHQSLPVSIVLVSNPDQIHQGKLVSIAGTTEEDLTGNPVVRGIANIEGSAAWSPRPGAKIVANIHCGRKSLAYVWFHEPFEAIRAALF